VRVVWESGSEFVLIYYSQEIMTAKVSRTYTSAGLRLLTSVVVGLLAALVCMWVGAGRIAVLAAWDITILVYGIWVWLAISPMSAAQTKAHAISENPGRVLADAMLLIASVASLGAVAILIAKAGTDTGAAKAVDISLGLISVVLSWGIVHVTYLLKYARLYYGEPEGGIDFNENDPPKYSDFAYVAFTLGMTFQVSDTALQTKEFRSTVLKHCLLAYLFGTVIIATMINTLASLSQ
jgi:uncharacterized membrane protein